MERKRRATKYLPAAAALLTLPAALICFFLLRGATERGTDMQSEALEQAIRRSAVTCYAVEGRYPESFSYLVENYGLTPDFSRYAVRYTVSGGNVMPDIEVFRIGNSP